MNPHESAESEHYIKQGLVLDTDYKAIKKSVWDALYKIYKGEPTITCETNDIYTHTKRQKKPVQKS